MIFIISLNDNPSQISWGNVSWSIQFCLGIVTDLYQIVSVYRGLWGLFNNQESIVKIKENFFLKVKTFFINKKHLKG